MNNILKTLLAIIVSCTASVAMAGPVTLVSQADNWDYNFGSSFGSGGGATVTYSDFTSGYTGTSNGNAAFGNTHISGAPYNTYWSVNTSLYAQKTFTLSDPLVAPATLNVAIDNGVGIWINGHLAFQATAGGFTSIWEYSTSVDPSLFVAGLNTVSVLANDYGGATYFDMELTGTVPEPSMLGLLALSLMFFALQRRRGHS